MTEQELRALVREAVARHLGTGAPPPGGASIPPARVPSSPASHGLQASHELYMGLVNVGEACVIEPAFPCDHCGYCKSHGH